MGGFTYNGMGWGDCFYPKKDLGKHYCYQCKSIQEFALMEVKSKVKILYIPTISFKTRFAVGCKKCKSGYYVDENGVRDLLYDRISIEVAENEVRFHPSTISGGESKQDTPVIAAQDGNGNNSQENVKSTDSKNDGEGSYEIFRQTFLEEEKPHLEKAVDDEPLTCKNCGAALKPHQFFCSSCGLRIR